MKLGVRSHLRKFWMLSGLCAVFFSLSLPSSTTQSVAASTQATSCQHQDIETLTAQLLKDLPSYANRSNQRARRLSRITTDLYTYVLLAGKPEFAPLTLGPGEYNPAESPNSEQLKQVFITTLERQYTAGKAVELQQFHWLFFTQTSSGWQLAMMFSRTGTYPNTQPPTPPQETSDGDIAQAIQTWLRDCQAEK